MKQITLEEAQLLYDLGAYPCYKNEYGGGWIQMRETVSRPGISGDDRITWGIPEDDDEEKML